MYYNTVTFLHPRLTFSRHSILVLDDEVWVQVDKPTFLNHEWEGIVRCTVKSVQLSVYQLNATNYKKEAILCFLIYTYILPLIHISPAPTCCYVWKTGTNRDSINSDHHVHLDFLQHLNFQALTKRSKIYIYIYYNLIGFRHSYWRRIYVLFKATDQLPLSQCKALYLNSRYEYDFREMSQQALDELGLVLSECLVDGVCGFRTRHLVIAFWGWQ